MAWFDDRSLERIRCRPAPVAEVWATDIQRCPARLFSPRRDFIVSRHSDGIPYPCPDPDHNAIAR